MPALVAWIGALLESRLGTWVIQVLMTLGISFVTYKAGVEPFRELVAAQFSAMPAMYANIIGYLWIDRCFTMIFSAYAAKQATSSMSAVLTRKGAASAS